MATSSVIPDRILRFLNALPVSGDPFVFRDALLLLFEDVDRIAINVNIACDLENPEEYRPSVAITKQSTPTEVDGGYVATSQVQEVSQASRLLESLKRQGYPLDQYHPLHGFDYYYSGQAYIGTIFLWREIAREPISQETIDLMRRMEPFIIFVLSDLVIRRQRAEPDVRMFSDALLNLFHASGLSNQEQRVIILQLFGHSYKEMADMLGISVDGVKHHLKMIHRKTGTRSYTELFAKYFTPRLDLQAEGEGTIEEDAVEEDVVEAGMVAIEPPMREQDMEIYFYGGERTLGERIRRFGEIAFGSVEEFAKGLKIAPSNLQKYLSGERNPGLGMLQRLHELGCNVNALISGDGGILADNDAGRAVRNRAAAAVTQR